MWYKIFRRTTEESLVKKPSKKKHIAVVEEALQKLQAEEEQPAEKAEETPHESETELQTHRIKTFGKKGANMFSAPRKPQ